MQVSQIVVELSKHLTQLSTRHSGVIKEKKEEINNNFNIVLRFIRVLTQIILFFILINK